MIEDKGAKSTYSRNVTVAPKLMQEHQGEVIIATVPDHDPVRDIGAFHRFHFRLTLLYGSAVIITFAVLVYVFYTLWTQSEIHQSTPGRRRCQPIFGVAISQIKIRFCG